MGTDEASGNGTADARSYWRWRKDDFIPEESFQSWNSYFLALSQTGHRFKDRFLARSDESAEVSEVRMRSENDMKRCLNWWDLVWFGFGSVIGAGIFVLTGQEAHEHAGPAIVLSYVVSGLAAMLAVFCYTEFAIEIPVAGGSFAYLRVELGDFVAFIAAANLLLESIIGGAAVSRAWTSYFATLLNHQPNSFRIHVTSLAKDFNYLDPIAIAVLWIAAIIAMTSTRKASFINWFLTLINTLGLILVIVMSFWHGSTSNLQPFFPFGASGVFRAAAVVFFAYGGFDRIATMAEETKNPSRDIPMGLLGSMSLIIVIYCLLALSLVMMQSYTMIDPNAAYSLAFEKAGLHWVKILVALGALKGMSTVLLLGSLGHSRYVTHIARAHMLPPLFALVHPKTHTPIYATLLVTILKSFFAFFSSLHVLANLLSVSTLFIFVLMSIALLVRRYYHSGSTPRTNLIKLACFLLVIIGSSVGTAACWGIRPKGWIGYTITVPLWFMATLGLSISLPQQRFPKVWGVPLVPWLPSLSITVNLFLMGSLDYLTFIRFALCSLVMIVYYVLFGLHATYDTAHQKKKQVAENCIHGGVQVPVA
ncbi:unnamed protein product [Victoria cruziana]